MKKRAERGPKYGLLDSKGHPAGWRHRYSRGCFLKALAVLVPLGFLISYVNQPHVQRMNPLRGGVLGMIMGQDVRISIPATAARHDDDYWCTAIPVRGNHQTINAFVPEANPDVVHHMILSSCPSKPTPLEPVRMKATNGKSIVAWDCLMESTCPGAGGATIMYAWARGADRLDVGEDTGMVVGSHKGVNAPYMVLQSQFLRKLTNAEVAAGESATLDLQFTPEIPKRLLGMNLFANSHFALRPQKEKVSVNAQCCIDGSGAVDLFAYRVHAHAYSRNISLSVEDRASDGVTNGYNLVIHGDPQKPHYFTKVSDLSPDLLSAAQRGLNQTQANALGGQKELRLRYGEDWKVTCDYNTMATKTTIHVGEGHAHEMCNMYFLVRSHVPFRGSCYDYKFRPSHPDFLIKDGVDNGETSGGGWGLWKRGRASPTAVLMERDLGQVGGLHFGYMGNPDHLLAFHRAMRVMERWDHPDPISEDVFIVWDAKKKKALKKFGRDLGIKLPHGLTIDRQNNIWLTDVDTQLVYKLDPSGSEILMTVGVANRRRSSKSNFDKTHLCRPTEVAVANNGDFFVSDGYCNARVVKYNKHGDFLFEFQLTKEQRANVPHNLILDDCKDELVVADRENALLRYVHPITGSELRNPLDLSRFGYIYAVTRDEYGTLYCLCWMRDGPPKKRKTFLVQIHGYQVTGVELVGARFPHDLAVQYNFKDHALDVYVGETGTDKASEKGKVSLYRLKL